MKKNYIRFVNMLNAIKEFLDFIMTSEENEVITYRNQYINKLSEIQYNIL